VTKAALAVDAGQTAIRAALVDYGGGPRSTVAPGVVRVGSGAGADVVTDLLLAAVAKLGPLPAPAPAAAIGLSGFEAVSDEGVGRIAEQFRRGAGIESLAIASDGLTALLGAIGRRDGVVVAAGTGTACLARRGARFSKVDGWGSLLGDAGSGFAIGRAGLAGALREHDGRGGSAGLLQAAMERFGPVERLPEQIYSAQVPTRAVAAFAADVGRVAEAGDEYARTILSGAAGELAISTGAAARRLFEPGEPLVVSYSGSVFEAGELIAGPFRREVVARLPGASVVEPAGDPLAGALLLVELAEGMQDEPGILRTWP
jgi:N-acetylglucosamine kinase-like BadF-type ATPase